MGNAIIALMLESLCTAFLWDNLIVLSSCHTIVFRWWPDLSFHIAALGFCIGMGLEGLAALGKQEVKTWMWQQICAGQAASNTGHHKAVFSCRQGGRLCVTWVLLRVSLEDLCSIPVRLEGAAGGFISIAKGA